MTTRRPDFDQLPAPLKRLGVQFRDLEEAEHASIRPTPRKRRFSLAAAGVLLSALVAVIVVFLAGGNRANALNVINRAPAAAAASESVRFRSTITISTGAAMLKGFLQIGEIDFASHEYATTLYVGRTGEAFEQRRLDQTLYVAHRARGSSATSLRWLAFPVAHEAADAFVSAPESEEFTNPLVLLDELAGTRASVKSLGPARVDGTPTDRYLLRTNLAALLGDSRHAGPQPAIYRQVPVVLVVWLDRQGRPRRVQETVGGRSAPDKAKITTVTDFTAYSQPLALTAPSGAVRLRRNVLAPNPLSASPSRNYEQLLFAAR